jgi:hypothetical protein
MKYILTNGRMLLAIVALLLGFAPRATGADEDMVELKTRTATYTNVTVARKDGTNIYIKHDGGMANVKLGELDPDTQRSLGYAVAFSQKDELGADSQAPRIRRAVGEPTPFFQVEFNKGVYIVIADREIYLDHWILACLGGGYVLFCCCSFLLCKKTGTEPGILIWFPILQLFPLLRAAGMSGWWFLMVFIPVLNIVAWLGWCVNIVIQRRKSLWWALLLILPITNVSAFLYLSLAKKD